MTANVLHSDGRAKDPAVERLIQKLEEVCDKIGGDESIAVMKCDTSSAMYVPMRIREIVQEYLSPSKWDPSATKGGFSRENDLLRRELEKAQELVKQSQRDCQDLSSKYITVSAKIEEVVGLEQKVVDLQHENRRLQGVGDALRQQLNQQEGTHSLHLQALQDGEERQAELVQTLQDKVLQYKDRCSGLEASLHDVKSVSDKDREHLVSVVRELEECVVSLQREKQEEAEVHHEELRTALDRGEEHQQRSLQLAMANNKLRQQLEEAHAANSRLMEDVHQLTVGWKDTQQKLKEKETLWRESIELESGRSVRSHQLSLSLALKDAMATRNEFSHLKTAVQRELTITHSEFDLIIEQVRSRVQQVEGFHLAVKQRMAAGLQHKEMECAQLTADLASLKLKYEALQTNHNLSMADLNQRLTETKSALHESEHTCRERSKVIEHLEASNTELERNQTDLTSGLQDLRETASSLQTEVKVLKSALDNIIQVFTTSDEKDQEVSESATACPEERTVIKSHFLSPENGFTSIPSSRKSPGIEEGGPFSSASLPSKLPGEIKPQWMMSPPKVFGTAGDVTRLKDWAVSVVRHGVKTRDDTIQVLQHELGMARGVSQGQEQRLREKEEEIRAHTTASTAIKGDLDSCHAHLQELTRARAELEQQLEEANSHKCEVERQLTQSMARLDNLLTEKIRMEESNSSLQETINSIRYDLEQLQQVKESQEVELTSRQNTTRKLEVQLTSVVEEAESLRARITELQSVKLNLEKETSQCKLSVATLEMEKEGLQKELRGIHESESSAVETLNELRVTNRELEAEKRQLTRSLQEVSEVKARLDEENIELERIKMTNEEELQKLKSANAHLNEHVGQLDKSLGESEMSKVGMHSERGRLKQEVTTLSEALGKSKQALAEVQIQRGKLNNTIAKMAQEKGDLVREKISLSTEVTKLQEGLQLSEERLAALKVAKDRLEQKVQEVEKRLVLAELNQSSLEEANFMLQQEKHDLSIQNGQLGRKKEEELSQLQSEKDLELHQAIVRAKSQESDLQGELQQVKATSEQEMKDLERVHTEKIATLTHRHSDIVSHLQGEIASLTKANRAEVERLTREKEGAVSHLEDEKALLADRISKLQKLFDEKCDESHYQHQHNSHIATEQKVQLDASHQNGRRLESELNAAEQQLQALQAKVDQVRLEASNHVESLKNQLRDASHTISQLEQSQDDTHLAIKQLEAKKDSLRHQCTESQKHLEYALQEKEELRNDCQVLRQNLATIERELVRSEETAASLQERLSRLENIQSSSQSNAITTQQTLARVEQLHAKLVSEHAALQATLTSTDKQNGSLQLELKAALEKASQLNKQKEDLACTLSSVENQLKVVSKTCELREEETSSYRQRTSDLERERNELSLNLTKLQQCSHTQGQFDTAKQSELQVQLSELKSIRITLQDKVCLLETTLESTQRQYHDLDSKLSASQRQVVSLTSQLKHTDSSHKDIQTKYNQLLSVLEGTLGFADEMRESAPVEIHFPFNPKERSLDASSHFSISLAESGVGTSIVSPSYSLHSSMCATQASEVLGRARTPSKLFRMKLDADSVREAILQFQKKLISAEKSKQDAISSTVGYEKKIRNLEEEKASLQARLQTLRSSLTSLQSSFDSIFKQRDSAEVTTKLQKSMIKDLERKGKEFEHKVKDLKNQLEGEKVGKQSSDTKLKKYAKSQVVHEIEIKKLETRLKELELQKRLLGEEITRLQKDLQSAHATKDAEIEQLWQKLATAHETRQEAEEQLKSMKDGMNDLDQSFKISKRKHPEKIQQLESELAEAQCEKMKQEQKASDLQQRLDSSQRDNDVLEERLHLLTHGQLETTSQMRQLHGHIKGLERSVSHGEMVKAELSSRIQAVEMQLQEREGGSLKLESQLLELTREKQVLVTRLENLQSTLETATKSKTIAQDLCSNLENEIDHLRKDLQKLRDENTQLKVDLRESQFQTERLDVLVSSQQKQKVEIDHSLVSSSKENVELMRNVRELQTNQAVKDREQQRKLTEVRLEVERLHGIQKLRDAQWSGKEQSYKKTIQHLEEKVSVLEAQIRDIKHKKAKYIQEARGYEEAIQGLRSVLGTSVQQLASNGLDNPATIDQETSRLNQSAMDLFDSPMNARRHYNPNRSLTSPTRSFLSPSGQFVPLTSTPTKRGATPFPSQT